MDPRAPERDEERSSKLTDPVRVQRLRQDAARPMSVNLAEGIALSHKLLSFAGTAAAATMKR